MYATRFGPNFGYRQILYEKHLEEEYCCTVTMSKVQIFHFSTKFILIKNPGFTDRAE